MDLQLASSLPCDAVKAQLAHIVDGRQFRNAPRLSRFLTYVVEQNLAGRSDQLKGYTIGVEVFDKDEDFDPQTDTIVRVQARALRQKLSEYYQQNGADDPVHIFIAKGGYVPEYYVPVVHDQADADDTSVKGDDRPSAPTPSDKPSIAVLPFENIGLGVEHDFLSLGLNEGVISDLSRFKYLSVFSRSTTEKAKELQLSIAQMFQRFRPDFVLEGTFRVRNELIETRIKLIDAAQDSILMTTQIDMELNPQHIFDAQDELCARIAARIGVDSSIGQTARQSQRSRPAIRWDTYSWTSRYFEYGFQLDKTERDEIEAGLKSAVDSEPSSADAHAALAMIEVEYYRTMSADVGDPIRLEQAIKQAQIAVRCDPQNAMAYQSLALAQFHAKRFVDFRASVKRALQLNPGHADMLAMFGMCFVRLAEWDEAMPLLDRALTLNPLHPDWYHMPKAMHLMMTQNPEAAIAEFTKRPMPGLFAFHYILLWLQVEAGNMKEAEMEKGRLLDIAPDVEQFTRRYFDAICLCDEIADRAIAACQKVGLYIA
ncbi:TolB amino-terminal domain-containing protein [Sulfitobacter marinus]|uniref:TolB amino-terminal domain-containing protein n=1 Tax=Sulfitobacter marinus TaxID=394264 RepID=A0A1I6UJ99_9RHOB|nr:tetratricopeptide repeat protein [Sulfitobacter marinus]SFT01508.1 TolB amino-terminal domain-containing protein [Sulfitobacter marinus]